MPFAWPAELGGLGVSYATGMEHNPMTRHGHSVLALGADDNVALDNRRAGAWRGWRGRLAPGMRVQLLEALRLAGFPSVVSAIDPTKGVLPDSSTDTVTVTAADGRGAAVHLLSYDTAARAPYRAALGLLESLLVQASGGDVGFGPDVLPPASVVEMVRAAAEPIDADGFLGLWLDAGGRALYVERDDGGKLRATIAPSVHASCYRCEGFLGAPRTTRRLLAKPRESTLVVEAGAPGLGPTYVLAAEGESLRPSVGIGLYDDFDDDLGVPWAFPLSPYHRAGADALATYRRTRRAGLVGWLHAVKAR